MRRPGYSSIVLACASIVMAVTSCSPADSGAPLAPDPDVRLSAESQDPSLLVCPTNTTVSAVGTIGLSGGSVTAGGTTIVIPAGAVPEPQTFTVTVPASRLMEVQITAQGHEHFQFLSPVQVTVDYSRCNGNPATLGALSAYFIDDETKLPLELMPGTDDKATHRYSFTTGHLSGYAIAN